MEDFDFAMEEEMSAEMNMEEGAEEDVVRDAEQGEAPEETDEAEKTAADRLIRLAQEAGVPKELAGPMVLGRLQARVSMEELDLSRLEKQRGAPYLEFARRFPQADMRALPDQVYEAALSGGDMAAAYVNWQNGHLQARLQMLEAGVRAGQMSAGPAAGEPAAAQQDEGWQSFLSAAPGA